MGVFANEPRRADMDGRSAVVARCWSALDLVLVIALASLAGACRGKAGAGAETRGSDVVGVSTEATQTLSVLRGRAGSSLPGGVAQGFHRVEGGLTAVFGSSPEAVPARVLLRERSTEPFHVEDAATGTAIDVSLEGAREARALVGEGYLVYERAHVSGATVLHRPLRAGLEDYLSFDRRPTAPSISYKVALGKGVAGLRLVANTLEMLDASGAPRLRAAPPYLTGANGAQTDATLAVEGCAFDRNPAPPWDRPVTEPGASSCVVRVAWDDAAVRYPAILDPSWTTTGSMATAREDHTMTYLPLTTKILATGGRSTPTGTTGLSSAELFDPATNTWAATGSMTGGRFLHSATALNPSSNATTGGKVLVAGGINGSSTLSTAQLFSPSAGTWVAAASLNAARNGHAAALLADGRVLVAGGSNGSTTLNTAARFDPASGSGAWTAVANMASARKRHTATTLLGVLVANGNLPNLSNRVLVVGGNSGTASLSAVEVFQQLPNGTTNWTTIAALPSTREGHTATALVNGSVLVTGGKSGSTTLNTTQLFNPTQFVESWSSAGTMTSARQLHTATQLAGGQKNGRVLVVGGSSGTGALTSAELWNGATTWTATTALPSGVRNHGAVVLSSGKVLIAGGDNGTTTATTSRIFDPTIAPACTMNSQCASQHCVNNVCCNTACTNQCFACNLPNSVGTCTAKPNGSGCDDNNKCTQTDTCQAGVCTGSNPKTCPPIVDACRPSATCDSATGLCPVAPINTSCSDGNVCNGDEKCDGKGVCKAGTPMICVASGACTTAGLCDPTLGCQTSGGQGCTVTNTCTTPANCSSSVNVPDPTPTMEDQCWRLRDVALRFIEYSNKTVDPSPALEDPNYIPSIVKVLNETYARACLTFHARPYFVVRNTVFSDYSAPFNWTAEPRDFSQSTARLGVPQNPNCAFNMPTGMESARDALANHILQTCGLPDEINFMSNDASPFAGISGYPSRVVIFQPGSLASHEVGHNFSLVHSFDDVRSGIKPLGSGFTFAPQTLADSWDIVYAQGNSSTMNRFFIGFDDAQAAELGGQTIKQFLDTRFGGNYNALGIFRSGTYTDPSMTTFTYSVPPKTGTTSCTNPPDGLGPCSTRNLPGIQDWSTFRYCFNCEFGRMYEAWNGQGSFQPSGAALGLLFPPGQTLDEWRFAGSFTPGFAGFAVEKGNGTGGAPMQGFAPKLTKLQAQDDPNRRTTQAMSYSVAYRVPSTIADGSFAEPPEQYAPVFPSISDSQAVLVRNTLKADLRSDSTNPYDTIDPFNPHKFGRYPARGSWEKIGQNLSTLDTVVPTTNGVFIAAKTTAGQVVYRHWSYGDAPWASQSNTSPIISGAAWEPVLPTQPRLVMGRVSGAYRPNDALFDMAIHQVGGSQDEVENAIVRGNGSGMWGWGTIPAGIQASPVLLTRTAAEGDRLDMIVLGTGTLATSTFYVNEWSRTGSWTGWLGLGLLPNAYSEFDAAARPDGTMDLAVVTTDGGYHNAVINTDLSWWGWGDLGNPAPDATPPGYRPSIASTVNSTSIPGSSYLQIDLIATDSLGRVHNKIFTDYYGAAWYPSQTGWYDLGGSGFGPAKVTHTVNSDIDIVARDPSSNTVRFKRFRAAIGAWSPGQTEWFNLGGEANGTGDPIAVPRAALPDVVDVFYVSGDGSLWHRPYVVPPYVADPLEQQYDVDYDFYCGCGMVTATTAPLPAARLGSTACPCSR
jgi:hypothetical protein